MMDNVRAAMDIINVITLLFMQRGHKHHNKKYNDKDEKESAFENKLKS